MVYPTITISNDEAIVDIIDSEFSLEPIISLSSSNVEDSFENFFMLTMAFLNQYRLGYDDGYEDAACELDDDEESIV